MEEHLQKADRVQLCVRSILGLMEISACMEATTIRDSLVSLGGGGNGVAGTRGRGKVWLWRGVLCAAVDSRRAVGKAFIVLPECGREFYGAWDDFCWESDSGVLRWRTTD
jgi:hypothetical protein